MLLTYLLVKGSLRGVYSIPVVLRSQRYHPRHRDQHPAAHRKEGGKCQGQGQTRLCYLQAQASWSQMAPQTINLPELQMPQKLTTSPSRARPTVCASSVFKFGRPQAPTASKPVTQALPMLPENTEALFRLKAKIKGTGSIKRDLWDQGA